MKKLVLIAGAFALFLSMGTNLLMIHRNQQWKALADIYSKQLSPPLGRKMPPLEGLDGSQRSISLDVADPRQATVIFVFSPECSVCKRNWKNWDTLLASRSKDNWKPVFVNSGPAASQNYRAYHNLQTFPLIDRVSKDSVLAYRMFFTPETLVLNRDGVITDAWVGVLTGKEIASFSNDVKPID